MASISTAIFDELLTTVEVIGIESTIKALQEAKSKSLILQDLDIDFILNSVSIITSVPKDRILNGNDRNDDRKIAIAVCVFFIKNEYSYSYNELSRLFNNKTVSTLSRYNTLADSVPKKPKTEFDKRLDNTIKKMNLLITEKKLKNGETIRH